MPRFVFLRHETPAGYPRESHFDLMLEHQGALLTWALDELPIADRTTTAERLADHRLAYLEYDGEVAGGRGTVTRVEAGEFEWISQTPGHLELRLHGQKLRGILQLTERGDDPQRSCVSLWEG